MKMLALETSGTLLSLALFEDAALKLELAAPAPMRQNESLAPLVQELLGRLNWKAGQLEAVAVSLGPGSFTGLRTGLAFAKGLCYATGAAMVGIPTLQAWAEGEGLAEVWLDARRGMAYRGAFKDSVEIKAPCMLALEQARIELGSGFKVVGDLVEGSSASAARVGRLALKRLQQGLVDSPASLEPIYLRRPEAEILWEGRHPRGAHGA